MNPKEKLNFEKMSIEEKEEFLVKGIKKNNSSNFTMNKTSKL
jgi:hypothetical protein